MQLPYDPAIVLSGKLPNCSPEGLYHLLLTVSMSISLLYGFAKYYQGIKKAREFQKNIYFCFIDYAKACDCVDHNKLWEILQEMGIPDHLTCLLRNLYTGQETTVRNGHGTTDWLQIRKGVKATYCHPAYLTYMQSTS